MFASRVSGRYLFWQALEARIWAMDVVESSGLFVTCQVTSDIFP